MQLVLQLALRNIWRQRRRNGLVLLAIVLSIAGVFVMNSLSRGMEKDFLSTSVENLQGHIKLLAPRQLDEPGFKHLVAVDVDLATLDVPGLLTWSPRLRSPAVVMSERETRGVEIVGIDPARETHSFFEHLEIEGESVIQTDDRGIVIGRRLADDLKTAIGRRLVVIMSGPDEVAIETGFRVQGIFTSEIGSYEDAYAFTGLAALKKLANTASVSEISVHVDELNRIPAVQTALAAAYPTLSVLTWVELDPFTGEMYGFIGFTIYILIAVFMCTLIFGLINALVTAVLERTREFGMLRAVGMKSSLVVLQVVVECVIIMMLGLVLGIGIGLLLYWWLADGIDLTAFAAGVEAFSMKTHMVPQLVVEDFVIISVASLLLGLIASYFPARRIIKTSILQSLRDG